MQKLVFTDRGSAQCTVKNDASISCSVCYIVYASYHAPSPISLPNIPSHPSHAPI